MAEGLEKAAARVPKSGVPLGGLIRCPVCAGPPGQQKFLFIKQQVEFRRCTSCGFEMVNPRPTEDWFKDRYEYYGKEYFLDDRKLASDFRAARFDLELSVIRPHRGALLDVGCSTGAFVKLAQDAGFDAQGVDLSETAIRYGRDTLGLRLHAGDFASGMFAAGQFDIVTMWATLEHLPNPGLFLTEARRVLKPAGILAVSVPNHRSLPQRILGRKNRYVGVDHVNYFGARTLGQLLSLHGYASEHIGTRKINPVVIYQDLRGRTPEGASVDQVISDQCVTDAIKTRPGFAGLRVAHSLTERALGRLGLGDVLFARVRATV